MMNKFDIIDSIEKTLRDREDIHGDAEINFENISALWGCYFSIKGRFHDDGIVLSKIDFAIMMILMKIGRLASNPYDIDSSIDIAGYAACLGEIQSNINKDDGYNNDK